MELFTILRFTLSLIKYTIIRNMNYFRIKKGHS